MVEPVRSTSIQPTAVSDDLLVNRGGSTFRQSVTNLGMQLVGSGPVASELDALREEIVTSVIVKALWDTGLRLQAPTENGKAGQVLDGDTGTHLQATATGYDGAVVPNAGRYEYNLSWGRWVWKQANVMSPATKAQAVAGEANDRSMTPKTSKDAIEARVGPGGTLINTIADRWYRGKRLLLDFIDSSSRAVIAVTQDGMLYAKFAIGVGSAANGLTWSQDANGIWRVNLGSVSGLVPISANGDTIDTRSPRYYQGKEVAWELKFSGGQVAIVVTRDGMVYIPKGSFTIDLTTINAAIAALQTLRPSLDFVFYGDSLTAADIPSRFAALNGRTTYNRGIGGQTSNQIAQRQGGNVPRVTISGNQIVTGANTITAFNGNAVSSMAASSAADQLLSTASDNTTRTVKATIANVLGTVTRTASGGPPSTLETYTFTPDAGQTLPVTCPPLTPMIVEVSGDDRRTAVFWPGRNNDWATAQIEQDADAMVSRLATAEKRFVIMSVLNGEYPNEYAGSAKYLQLTTRNGNLQAKYPNNFLDIRRYLIDRGLADAGITPTSQDTIDVGRDIVPVSLRSDNIHLNATARQLVAARLEAYRAAKGW